MQYNTTIRINTPFFFINKIGGISAFQQKYPPLYFQEYSNNS